MKTVILRCFQMSMTIWVRSSTSDSQEYGISKVCPREWLFDNVVVTEIIVDDENICLKFFLDDHDHLGEVQRRLGVQGLGTEQGESQGMTFLQCC